MSNHQKNVSRNLRDAVEKKIISEADALEVMLQAIDGPKTAEKILRDKILNSHQTSPDKNHGCELANHASKDSLTECGDVDCTEELKRKSSPRSTPLNQESNDDATIAGGFRLNSMTASSKISNVEDADSAKMPWPTRSVSSKSASTFDKAKVSSDSSHNVRTAHNLTEMKSIKSGFARYEIREEIGRGGCGIVSLAFDHQLQRLVVVKQIVNKSVGAETAQRFLNEAQITGQLEHPGIVPVYEMGEDQSGLPFYAMKFLDGKTLADVISDHRGLPEGEPKRRSLRRILQRYLDVCNTIAFSHESGIIHRDLKPANIMVGQFGETIVLDWGLARRIEFRPSKQFSAHGEQTQTAGSPKPQNDSKRPDLLPDSSSQISPTPMTMQGSILGTAAYMAPEQAKGNISQLDRRSDVFSLGVILYEILSGTSPFRGDTLNDTIHNVTNGHYKKLRTVSKTIPKPLAAICEKAMHSDQDARYENAGLLANDIEAYLSGQSTVAHRENLLERIDRIADRHRTLFRSVFMATILVALVAIIAAGKITNAYQSEKSARQLAVAAKEETESALVAESEAKQHALQRLAIARGSIDNWLIQLSGDLQFYPGLGPIRNQLIESGKTFYQQLWDSSNTVLRSNPKRANSDRHSNWLVKETLELAKNSIRLGDLFRLQNDLVAAEKHYSVASNSLSSILPESEERLGGNKGGVSTNPSDMRPHQAEYLQLANAQIGLALCKQDRKKGHSHAPPNDKKTNRSFLKATHDILSELVNLSPKAPNFRNALARAKLVQGRFYASEGLTDKSIVEYQAAITECNILIQTNDEPRHVELKSNLLRHLAQAQLKQQQYESAISVWQNLITHLDQRIDQNEPRPDWLEERSWATMMLGQNYAQLGQTKRALQQFKFAKDSLESAKRLLYGDEFYLENQSIISLNLGHLQNENGQSVHAEESLRASVDQLRSLIKTNGATTERIKQMAKCYQTIGQARLHRNENDAQFWFNQHAVLLDHLQSQPDSKVFALKQKTEAALIQAEHFASNDIVDKCTSQLSLASSCYNQLLNAINARSELDSNDRVPVCNSDIALLCARISRLEVLCGVNQDAKGLKEQLDTFRESVSKVPMNAVSHSFGLFTARTYCEFSAKNKSFLRYGLQHAEQLSERFNESHSVWFACAVTRLLNGQYRQAAEAMQQVRLCRVEETPIESMLDCLLKYHDDRIPKSEWEENWNRAMSSCPATPWRKILKDAYAEITK